ncbi:MAG: C10 family peptidase [Bacteroidales bacterium]|nr:C10 family peptidase [Bacteroidales bacterium]
MKKLFFVVMSFAAMLLMACNGIETTGLDTESVGVNKKTSSIVRDVNVTQNEAIGIANMFARSNGGDIPQTKGAFSSTKMISSSETIREDGQNLMYVFNYEGGGFVIVGSTRNYYPILAYSDEGSFILQDDMGPVDVWLDETKVGIKNSSSLDNATKAQMQDLWARYDGTFVDPAQELLAARRPQTRSIGEDYCWDRIDSLQQVYGSDGWVFLPVSFVEDLFTDLDLESYYEAICYSAEQNHSALNETLIGYRLYNEVTQSGPLLNTEWYQESPFGDSCPNSIAGCGAVAAGQVMYFHRFPVTLTWKGEVFYWSQIPRLPSWHSYHRQPQLMGMLGQKFQMVYNSDSTSSTTITKLCTGLDSLGYNVSSVSHNYNRVRDTLLCHGNPVIMQGKDPTHPTGHFWVCDGVRESLMNQIQFFSENQPYGAGSFTQGMYSLSNPGIDGGIVSIHFHMNWGKGSNNTWYLGDSVNSPYGNYQNLRHDIYVNVP